MSIAAQVHEYIEDRPVLLDAYQLGIVNYSALARRIQDDLDLPGSQAILSAVRRFRPAMRSMQQKTVDHAMEHSQLEIRNRVGLLQFQADWRLLKRLAEAIELLEGETDRVRLLHGWQHIQLVGDEPLLDQLVPMLRTETPVEEIRGLVELNIRSSEASAGFLAALTGSLASRAIRIIDAATCGDDHLLVIDGADLPAAVEQFNALMEAT